jgi:hypothetical protein
LDELIRLVVKVEHDLEEPFCFEMYSGISKRAEKIFVEFR